MIVHWLSGRRAPEAERAREIALAAALLGAALGRPLSRRVAAELRPHEAVRRFVVACGWVARVSLGLAIALMLSEGYGVFESVWEVWQTATTVGFGTHPASTIVGRSLILVFGTVDIALVGYAISSAFDVREHVHQLRRSGLMPNSHHGAHIVIHAPPERDLKLFIRGVRKDDPDAPVCVVDDNLDELPRDIAVLPHVHFVRGSALNPAVLERADVTRARSVVIYSMNKDDPTSDAATLTIVKLLWRLPGTFRVSYLLVEPANERLFESEFQDADARGRSRPAAVLRHMATLAAVTGCRSGRAAETMSGLVLSPDAAMRTIPFAGATTTWSRVVVATLSIAEEMGAAINAIAVAHVGATRSIVCPRAEETVGPGDHVVFNSGQGVDWAEFSDRLARRASPATTPT